MRLLSRYKRDKQNKQNNDRNNEEEKVMLPHALVTVAKTIGYLSDLKESDDAEFLRIYHEYRDLVGDEVSYYAQMSKAEVFYKRLKALELTSPLHSLVEFHRMYGKYTPERVYQSYIRPRVS